MIKEYLKSDISELKKVFNESFDKVDLEFYFDNDNFIILGEIGKSFAIFQLISGEAEIYYIAIKKEFRRKHLADELLNFFITNFDVNIIFLDVKVSNDPAISFYKKNGFKEIGIRKKYYENGEDAIIMEKKIC
ncbi:MAG: ribosomal protein S18-alanine N-acetyltransferase [Ezakiella sp.]|nr:ribosomal protein S18-alanine N-acetyltransferase [Ezakiella sp.]MDD7472319.1 ribosomal protein S18-alanine N-acetyltransferase [Bacillota bacterium]MDY3923056.1 ribosomal protein S18-alanine N-acetyltransferase [Ezakiella sp.]